MKHLLFIISLFIFTLGWAQSEEEKQRIIEQRIEFIGDNLEDSDIDLTTYFDELYYFFDNPINLNNTNFEELKKLRLLSDLQISYLLNYLDQNGQMLTIYELNAVETIDKTTLEMILPFVTLGEIEKEDFKWKNAFKYSKNEVFLRYEQVLSQKAGYTDPQNDSLVDANKQYLGSPQKYYLRFRSTYKDRLSYGLTAEKDAGEEFFKGANKYGFDFYSAHFFVNDLWKFKKLAVGDFQVNFGQGLTMWSGFGIGKSADVFNARRYAYGLRPYTSVNENQFLRGVGVNLDLGEKLDFTAFASYKRIDANINAVDSTDIFDNSFSSFQTSGYHRTVNEMDDKGQVGEFITGGEFAYRGKRFRIGVSSVFSSYDQPLNANLQPYNLYKFNGQQLLTSGINYRYYFRKLSFFGETSMSDNVKFGTVNGIAWHADPKLDLLVIYRNYDKAFQSLYSRAFGESSDNSSERGLYFGIQARLSKRVSATAYYDQFQYTSFKWLTDDLSEGREVFAQVNFNISRRASFYVRFRNKVTERDTKDDITGIDEQVKLNKTNIRVNYDQRINDRISLKSRVEWTRFLFDKDESNGLLLFQDLIFSFRKVPLKLYTRLAVFDADTYDARIYAYENDLLYVFSIPSYYNRGMRTYLMAKYEIGGMFDIWARVGLWNYQNVETISSGLEEIDGHNKLDLKIQVKMRF
ncbi:helix-hairpin-helix domain-containing protein [Paracrocinitomix mangrovi]|uniref:helix-hairpin-helix domain-containing protein n=1 Tax=Paracrocinitomix mangrovi TaxID=2862509 RepID=UPI001C8D748C|nr:helix-hairpin-helix domain-containing protein [Paracrocinitomix mangrovi]UKN01420.1 helix-hairpin-helix domain-containing protein [Paracrocinitomix mangrovi]